MSTISPLSRWRERSKRRQPLRASTGCANGWKAGIARRRPEIRIAEAMLCLMFTWSVPLFAVDGLQLPEHLQQGQLVIGHAPPATQIEFQGHTLRIGADGVFVFGLARDAAPRVELKLRGADGQAQTRMLDVEQRSYPTERVNGLPQQTV
ncbi:MAG: hypothetical protein KGH92_11110, partial [Xanthomonadaceae bacterium]|nr:hypothetical protein [Xanthomonadaceae bacterium]